MYIGFYITNSFNKFQFEMICKFKNKGKSLVDMELTVKVILLGTFNLILLAI